VTREEEETVRASGRMIAELVMLENPGARIWPLRPKMDKMDEETRRRRIVELRATLAAIKEARDGRLTLH
jgi:hypothetical protein